ncbi:hypothetical protein FB451DRAFT_1570207 [Mycena latifolia]|nr:hypothetical protein FB451DRAFT_1570207 [Mycena latifolia]
MDVEDQPVPAAKKVTKKSPSPLVGEKPKAKSAVEGEKQCPAARRKYIPTAIVDSDDDSHPQPNETQLSQNQRTKSLSASSNAAKSTAVKTNANSAKSARKSAASDNADADSEDNSSQSEDEREPEDGSSASASGEEDTTKDILTKVPRLIPVDDDLLDFEPIDIPKVGHHRQSSSSSRASMPPDTDLDNDVGATDTNGSEPELNEDDEEPVVVEPRKKTTTAQQLKYDQEKPVIRASKVMHQPADAKPKETPESDWHHSARIVFPTTGGQLRLRDQKPLLGRVLKGSMDLLLYEISFKNGYETTVSRAGSISRLVRRVAKTTDDAEYIQRRAKKDPIFCSRLAPLIYTRGGNLRLALRRCTLSKIATHYELNKPGTTSSQIRAIIKQLMADQRYIFAYVLLPTPRPNATADGDVASATGDTVTVTDPKAVLKAFNTNLPFHAPAIVDMIHEVWWSGRKSIGFTHQKKLKFNREDRPTEVVLPDAMICLAGANVWAALQAWLTGRYVHPEEFSQGRLESTYNSLLTIMEEQRNSHHPRPSIK